MLIIPPKNKIAVSPVFPSDTIGNLYVPEQAKDRCKQGIVKYVGKEVKTVNIGDFVIFGAYTGSLIKIEDELLIFMKEEFVEAKIDLSTIVTVPGLYLKDEQGYFAAPYNAVIDLAAKAVQDIVNDVVRIKQKAPDQDYYDKDGRV